MTEYENLLQNWVCYQKAQFHKRISMENMYRCVISYSDSRTIIDGHLSYISTQPEPHIRVTDGPCNGKILLSDLMGFHPEGQTIILNMQGGRIITLQFPDPRVHEAAFEKLEIFARNEVNASTPPSSDEAIDD